MDLPRRRVLCCDRLNTDGHISGNNIARPSTNHAARLGAYYYSRADDPNLIRRSVDFNDGALPNSNAVSALNLLKLHDLTLLPSYREKARSQLAADSERLAHYPSAYAETLIALDYYLDYAKEIAVIRPVHNKLTQPILSWLRENFIPNKSPVLRNAGAKQHSSFGCRKIYDRWRNYSVRLRKQRVQTPEL
jgi:uncharacterized protein YyaL (SSP411 family)